jgi:MFS family permease
MRNYHILVAISLLQGFVFYAPVATVYRQAFGLSLAGLFMIESISWVLTLLLELPFGRFADRFGCRRTIVLGCFAFFASKIVFSFAFGFMLFLAERVLLSVAIAALSGASENFLYASAGPDEPERRFGLWNAAGTAGVIAASLFAPLLYRASLRYTAYATALAYGLAALLCLFLEEPRGEGLGRHGVPGSAASRAELGRSIGALFSDRPLLLFLVALAISNECAQAATVFLSQPQYRRAGIGEASYGLLYALVQCAALAGAAAGRLVGRLGRRAALTALVGVECLGASALAASSSAWVTVAALLAMSAAASMIRPISTAVQLERIRVPDRATALSLNAMAGELVGAAFNAGEGEIAQRSLAWGFGAAAVALGLILVFSRRLLAAAQGRTAEAAPGAFPR